MLWNFIGVHGSSNWPVLWVGEAIAVPIMPSRRLPSVDIAETELYTRSSSTY
jgi:hypothetical protein